MQPLLQKPTLPTQHTRPNFRASLMPHIRRVDVETQVIIRVHQFVTQRVLEAFLRGQVVGAKEYTMRQAEATLPIEWAAHTADPLGAKIGSYRGDLGTQEAHCWRVVVVPVAPFLAADAVTLFFYDVAGCEVHLSFLGCAVPG